MAPRETLVCRTKRYQDSIQEIENLYKCIQFRRDKIIGHVLRRDDSLKAKIEGNVLKGT